MGGKNSLSSLRAVLQDVNNYSFSTTEATFKTCHFEAFKRVAFPDFSFLTVKLPLLTISETIYLLALSFAVLSLVWER